MSSFFSQIKDYWSSLDPSTKRYLKYGAALSLVTGGLVYQSSYILELYKHNVSYITPSDIDINGYDYIVIGAGTSGSVVTYRLASHKSKPKVLLIEAGSPDNYHALSTQVIPVAAQLNQNTNNDWQYKTESQLNFNCCKALINGQSNWPRGKVMGGSSVLNYMVHTRGDKEDYNSWSNKKTYDCGEQWNYENILPYFKKSENIMHLNLDSQTKEQENENKYYRGYEGPQFLSFKNPINLMSQLWMKACVESGSFKYNHDYNGKTQEGVSYVQYNTYHGRRLSSFRSYVSTLFDIFGNCKVNLHILPYSQVKKLQFNIDDNDNHNFKDDGNDDEIKEKDDSNNNLKVKGVYIIYTKDPNNHKEYYIKLNENNKNSEIILSAGAIGSPQILMLSGIGNKEDLEKLNSNKIKVIKNIPGVGYNLQDHITTGIYIKIKKDFPILDEHTTAQDKKEIFDYLFNGKGWLTSNGLDIHCFFRTEASKKYFKGDNEIKSNDIQIAFCSCANDYELNKNKNYFNYVDDEFVNEKKQDYYNFNVVPIIVMFLHPDTSGYLKLKSDNCFDSPIIQPNYLKSETNYMVEAWKESLKIIKKVINEKVITDIALDKDDFIRSPLHHVFNKNWHNDDKLIEEILRHWTLTIYHPSGTCKMGNINNNKMAVVDCNTLKVRGIKNLRVADASIMPHLTSGNTQVPCYMIGEKASDLVLKDISN